MTTGELQAISARSLLALSVTVSEIQVHYVFLEVLKMQMIFWTFIDIANSLWAEMMFWVCRHLSFMTPWGFRFKCSLPPLAITIRLSWISCANVGIVITSGYTLAIPPDNAYESAIHRGCCYGTELFSGTAPASSSLVIGRVLVCMNYTTKCSRLFWALLCLSAIQGGNSIASL